MLEVLTLHKPVPVLWPRPEPGGGQPPRPRLSSPQVSHFVAQLPSKSHHGDRNGRGGADGRVNEIHKLVCEPREVVLHNRTNEALSKATHLAMVHGEWRAMSGGVGVNLGPVLALGLEWER